MAGNKSDSWIIEKRYNLMAIKGRLLACILKLA